MRCDDNGGDYGDGDDEREGGGREGGKEMKNTARARGHDKGTKEIASEESRR